MHHRRTHRSESYFAAHYIRVGGHALEVVRGEITHRSESYFAAHYFQGMSSYVNVYYFRIFFSVDDINSAFAFHLYTLLDQRLLFGSDHAVLHCPGNTWSSG